MKRKINGFDIFNNIFFIIVSFICIAPILLILSNSLSSEADISKYGFCVIPLHPTFEAFKLIFEAPQDLIRAFLVSCYYAVVQPLITIIICAMWGYALSVNHYKLKRFSEVYLLITMFVSAGTIPNYVLRVNYYKLYNNIWVYTVPAVSAMMVFLFRTFFKSVPASLVESAKLDGATDMQILGNVIVPLSMPILASQFFLTMVAHWQNYTTALYYIENPKLYNLEFYIKQLMSNTEQLVKNLIETGHDASDIPRMTMRFAVVFLVVVPMITVFPLLQKHFNKGALAGSVKG